jgi:AcrR family transcriptional regulator
MARTRTASKENSILEAASRVFAQRPYHEVLIDEIASTAGIGKGTIYRYFETKDDLYFATVLHAIDSLAAALEESLLQEPSASRRLERVAREIVSFFWERRYLLPFLQRDERYSGRQDELARRREPILRLVQGAILSGIERREFRGVDARIGAETFLGMVRAIAVYHRDEDMLDELVGQVMGVFLSGVGRREP